MTRNDYSKITKYISSHRLKRYKQICANDKQKALKIYQTNLRLSQAFYPLLSLFEVILRNAINEELTSYFNDKEWLSNQVSLFMSHPSLTYVDKKTNKPKTNDFLKKSVKKIINKQGQTVVTQGRIIADLNFGFWTELFEKNHYSILQGRPIKIFSHLPAGTNRKVINQKLDRVRAFRNRVYHNEPIVFSVNQQGKSIFDLKLCNEVYQDIQELFYWIGLDYIAWTKRIDNIPLELERANYVYKSYPRGLYYIYRLKIGVTHYRRKYI